jgi:YMGG-like Gly-zipper
MTIYSRFQPGMIGVLGGALRVTSIGCSTPLHTREKGALIGGGAGAGVGALVGGWPGAAMGGALGAGGGALVGDQMEKQNRE